MRRLARTLGTVIAALIISGAANGQDLETMLYMDLENGRVAIEHVPEPSRGQQAAEIPDDVGGSEIHQALNRRSRTG